MSDSKIYALRIARQMAACERNADQLMVDLATLNIEMTHARLACDAFGVGQKAIVKLAEAQRALASVQSDLIHTHQDLLKVGQERGDMMDGNCPPASGFAEAA